MERHGSISSDLACSVGIGGGIDSVSGVGGFGDSAVRIVSYIISTAMDTAVLGDALNSLAHFSDKIYVVDGLQGRGTLCHYPLWTTPIRDWLLTRPEYDGGDCIPCRKWNGVSFTFLEHEFIHPTHQRNWVHGQLMELEPHADWVVWIDSDEVCSWEMINGIRDRLKLMPGNVVGVCPIWLNLVQDEQHCVGGQHSTRLAHPRIHRLINTDGKPICYSGEWHEHMVIDRPSVVNVDWRVIHTRALYRRILLVMRGHPMVGKRWSSVLPDAPMFWDDAFMEEIPKGVTWPTLHPPQGEIIPFPIEADAAKVWDYKTGEQIGRVEDA